MPRQRMVKPEFFESDSLAECSYAARLAFIGLWCQADDKGHAKASVRKLRKLIFPLEDMTDAEFEGCLAELERVGCIKHYEVDGDGYIEVVNFGVYQKVQHPSKTTIPDPPEGLAKTKVTHYFQPHDAGLCEGYGSPTVAVRERSCNGSPSIGLTLNKERSKEETILTTSKIVSPPQDSEAAEPTVENFAAEDAAIAEELEQMARDPEPQSFPYCPLCGSMMDFSTKRDMAGIRCHECPSCGPIPYTKAMWR